MVVVTLDMVVVVASCDIVVVDERVVDESVIVMVVDTIVADGIAVADTAVAEDERRSNVVVETYLEYL